MIGILHLERPGNVVLHGISRRSITGLDHRGDESITCGWAQRSVTVVVVVKSNGV